MQPAKTSSSVSTGSTETLVSPAARAHADGNLDTLPLFPNLYHRFPKPDDNNSNYLSYCFRVDRPGQGEGAWQLGSNPLKYNQTEIQSPQEAFARPEDNLLHVKVPDMIKLLRSSLVTDISSVGRDGHITHRLCLTYIRGPSKAKEWSQWFYEWNGPTTRHIATLNKPALAEQWAVWSANDDDQLPYIPQPERLESTENESMGNWSSKQRRQTSRSERPHAYPTARQVSPSPFAQTDPTASTSQDQGSRYRRSAADYPDGVRTQSFDGKFDDSESEDEVRGTMPRRRSTAPQVVSQGVEGGQSVHSNTSRLSRHGESAAYSSYGYVVPRDDNGRGSQDYRSQGAYAAPANDRRTSPAPPTIRRTPPVRPTRVGETTGYSQNPQNPHATGTARYQPGVHPGGAPGAREAYPLSAQPSPFYQQRYGRVPTGQQYQTAIPGPIPLAQSGLPMGPQHINSHLAQHQFASLQTNAQTYRNQGPSQGYTVPHQMAPAAAFAAPMEQQPVTSPYYYQPPTQGSNVTRRSTWHGRPQTWNDVDTPPAMGAGRRFMHYVARSATGRSLLDDDGRPVFRKK